MTMLLVAGCQQQAIYMFPDLAGQPHSEQPDLLPPSEQTPEQPDLIQPVEQPDLSTVPTQPDLLSPAQDLTPVQEPADLACLPTQSQCTYDWQCCNQAPQSAKNVVVQCKSGFSWSPNGNACCNTYWDYVSCGGGRFRTCVSCGGSFGTQCDNCG